MPIVTEHSIKIDAEIPKRDVSMQMDVFYNPVMASNRNISILLLNSISNSKMNIADPLAGSGIRSLRFLKELKRGKIKELYVNDIKENFPQTFKKNCELNKIKLSKTLSLHNEEATLFLLHCEGFDYIDIDPFGSPNPFLAAALNRISRNGILAITATDTAALSGTYPKVTKRKYWAQSLKNYLMHETGLRILIRRIQQQGIQFDKVLIPILSYHKEHYFRIYFRMIKSKEKCDELVQQHRYFLWCSKCLNYTTSIFNKEKCSCKNDFLFVGPLWIGDLIDQKLVQTMVKNNPFPEEEKFLKTLAQEENVVGFYDLHQISKVHKTNVLPLEDFLPKVKGTRTHFSPMGFKTKEKIDVILKYLK